MLSGRVDWWVWVGPGGHHDGGAFWFWYMDALSFNRAKQRWQLQLPDEEKNHRFIEKEKKSNPWLFWWIYLRWLARRVKTSNSPSGGSDMGGLRQYMWYPLSQSSQNRSWSWKPHTRGGELCETTAPLRGHLGSTHVVLRGSAHVAALALYALPAVRLHRRHHDGRELQTGWVACVHRQVDSALRRFAILHFVLGVGDTHLSARSRSRTPALLIGQSCGWFWSHPSRSRSNCWVTRAHPDLSLELQNEVWRQICV